MDAETPRGALRGPPAGGPPWGFSGEQGQLAHLAKHVEEQQVCPGRELAQRPQRSLSPAPSRFLLPSPATGRLEPRGHSPADANLECSEGQPRSPVGHTHWAPEERRDHNSYSELCKGPAILADA